MSLKNPFPLLSGNLLKLIAIVTMTFDHYAAVFHPGVSWMRIPGRIAFPIFAFLVAEGFRYTKNRLRYLLVMGAFAAVSHMAVLWISRGSWTSILATFTASIGLLFLLEHAKRCALAQGVPLVVRLLAPLPLLLAITVLYFDRTLAPLFDYGFFGVLLPVFASLFHMPRDVDCPERLKCLDILPVHLLTFGLGLLLCNAQFRGTQEYAILALVPLLLYSGKRGRWRTKYLFYIYYPVHILLLEGISLLFFK